MAIPIRPPIPMTVTAIMADIANHAIKEPWPSLEWASWIFARASFVLVGSLVLGVAATVAIVWMGIVKEHHWDVARDSAALRIAELNNETARLRAKEPLVDDALLANVHAARSNSITILSIRTLVERVAVAQGFITRELMSAAARSLDIIPKVTPFAGKKFDAVVMSSNAELGTLLVTLKTGLKTAGWIEIERSDPVAGTGIFSVDRDGGPPLVRIDVDVSKAPELSAAATALASALNEEGITAAVNPKAESDPANVNVIHIVILAGPKP